jgi:transposase
MNEITTIGLDLAKHVFQVHGVDASGATNFRPGSNPAGRL